MVARWTKIFSEKNWTIGRRKSTFENAALSISSPKRDISHFNDGSSDQDSSDTRGKLHVRFRSIRWSLLLQFWPRREEEEEGERSICVTLMNWSWHWMSVLGNCYVALFNWQFCLCVCLFVCASILLQMVKDVGRRKTHWSKKFFVEPILSSVFSNEWSGVEKN